MTLWQSVTWDIARAGGFLAYILLTLSVALGLALTMQWQTPRWPRLINNELHNFVTLLATVFVAVHILAVWIDPFTSFGLNEVLIPFVSHYRPIWMALGIIALYLGIAIGISTLLRPYIGYKVWRGLHVLTIVIFALVLVHGIATGSDTRTWWGITIYGGSILLIGSLLWQRLYYPANKQSRAHPVLAVGVVIAGIACVFWMLLGPLQPGWNTIANNGKGNGSVQAATAKTSSSLTGNAFTPSFNGDLQGQMMQQGPDANGNITLQLNMTISNGPQGIVQVTLQGQNNGFDNDLQITHSQVTLSQSNNTPLYVGPLTRISGERSWNMQAVLSPTSNTGKPLQVTMRLFIQNNGQVTGTITGSTTTTPNSPTGGEINTSIDNVKLQTA
jgi:hypothetical protein